MCYVLLFWKFALHLMKSSQHCQSNSGIKVYILDTCGAMVLSYFGITFLLFFIKVENVVYTSCQNIKLLFINSLIFDIMNTQNIQSLKFARKAIILEPLMINANHWRFSWFRNVFLKSFQYWLNSVTSRKLCKKCWSGQHYQTFISTKRSYRGKHMTE